MRESRRFAFISHFVHGVNYEGFICHGGVILSESAHGDEPLALKTLESGLTRFPNAAAVDLARAHLYRAELAVRTNNHELAQSSLAAANSLQLTDNEKASLADEFTHVAELLDQE